MLTFVDRVRQPRDPQGAGSSRPFASLPAFVVGILMAVVVSGGPAGPVLGQSSTELRPIGPEAYEIWRTIGSRSISDDGNWVLFTLTREDGDDELVIRHALEDTEYRIPRGAGPTFAHGDSRVVFRISPHVEAVREAAGNRDDDTPRDSLGVLDLASGERESLAMVQGFRLAPDNDRYLAVHLRPEADQVPGEGEDTEDDGTLLIWDLETGARAEHWYATDYAWAPAGTSILIASMPPETEDAPPAAGLQLLDASTGDATPILQTRGEFRQLTFDSNGEQVAFLHTPSEEDESEEEEDPGEDPAEPLEEADDEAAPERSDPDMWTLFRWSAGMDAPARITSTNGEGLRDGWQLSEHGSVSFSDDGTRLFFGSAPTSEPAPEDRPRLETEVDVEVWHWQDEDLMTVQRVRENQDRRRNYTAVQLIDRDRIVQLADEDLPSVNVGSDGDGTWATGTTSRPYAVSSSWESPNFRDAYLVEVETGERTLVAERSQGTPSLSPDEGFLTWYEPADSVWYVQDVGSAERRELSAGIPHPVWNEIHDSPAPAGSYGSAGWMDGENAILIHDRHDVWAVDPRDPSSARNLTGGHGRDNDLRYRLIRLDPEADEWNSDDEALASVFDLVTRDAGFSRVALDGSGPPRTLLMEARSFSNPTKAADANRLLFTQETFRDFPDLWVADLDFDDRTRMSEANPQQAEYRWGDAELVSWTSLDGVRLDGILIKPDDFDPSREYPMMVYFYDRSSDGLHGHQAPVPHRSVFNRPMYASHDYLVFVPDIVYREGYPGESAYNAVLPGVTSLIEQGFVDRERIALQGHSWGGYQIAFIVTRSRDLFRAAAAGAPVANMTSAYGGIRWDSGLVRQFQYERTQSRIGANLWDAPMRYIENSPLFWVDKIETPLLIMHNDEDGAVPWEQGIELFTAMRRLGKPAWLINYTGEPHWPTSFANKRDWNIRMKQFFDHFLKDEAPPVWMVEGIPAIRRGETLGYEPVEGVGAVDPDGR